MSPAEKYAERAREILCQLPFAVYEQHEQLVTRALEQAALEVRIDDHEWLLGYEPGIKDWLVGILQASLQAYRARLAELMETVGG